MKFEELIEIRKMHRTAVVEWLLNKGEKLEDIEIDIDEEGDGQIDVGGYYSDSHPVIEFENGYVTKWYRSEDWD
jgi:hypothetical protein